MINPTDRTCFIACVSCNRCAQKGSRALCSSCSGRFDPKLKRDPYDIDDRCRCREGVLQYRTKVGRLVVTKLPNNPFKQTMKFDSITQDEKEWEQYVDEERERLNDPGFDPVRFNNGQSTLDWTRRARSGR